MRKKIKEYRGIYWEDDSDDIAKRITINATSIEEAVRKLKEKYGENIKFSLYNEEDAQKPRKSKN